MADLKPFQDMLKMNSAGASEVERDPFQPPPVAPIIPKPVDGKVPRSQQCCGNCSAYMKMPDPSQQWVCAADPATPIIVGMAQMEPTLVGQKPRQMPIVWGFFPPMDPNLWCRRWALKVDET